MNNFTKIGVALSLASLSSTANAGLMFNITSTGNSQADAGFQLAADTISSLFKDDITVNITAGFNSLRAGVLGQASSNRELFDFSSWKSGMASDMTSTFDQTMVSHLPTGDTFNPFMNGTGDNPHGAGSTEGYTDNDGGANNSVVRLTRANAKALGMYDSQGSEEDAAITFSSDFSFDFDPTDGIEAGMIDFVGVATHEIMHAMGFTSGIDILDYYTMSGPAGDLYSDDAFTFVTGLDFTRHSASSQAFNADLDWTADSREKYFSIDGGKTALGTGSFSQGRYNGDGQQASHWKDHRGVGIMDPTAAPAGNLNFVSDLDIVALDVIGWDMSGAFAVPTPPIAFLFSIGLAGLFVSRRNN
ncbi:NF038122 family metalloprotease [Flocculibacter collagenilyticus]|uniref:NF038122 family metalloprotease n=1 Tax=Flocculibacter collagenilyticus TaxID=2744479 RepID=UPI0018F66591|nr:NF038122 family metalloprotease [Flocculibacter collagenilyticus]